MTEKLLRCLYVYQNKQTDKMNVDLKYIFFALAHEKEYLYSFEDIPHRQNAHATSCNMFRWVCLKKSSEYRSEKWVCHYQCAKRFIQKKNFTTSTHLIVPAL
jgi:hypothetical protein